MKPRRWIAVLAAWLFLSAWGYAFCLTDEMNQTVVIHGVPKRIITLAPSITEIVFMVGAGERVVGVSRESDFPEAARLIPKVGPYNRPNLEKIITLQPDLVIATADGTPKALVDELDRLRIPLFAVNPKSVEQVVTTIGTIGAAVQGPDTLRVVREMERAVSCIRNGLKEVSHQPRVLFQIGMNPLVSAGKSTFSNNVIALAGGINIAEQLNGKYPRLSIEQVVVLSPEVIIVAAMEKTAAATQPMDYWRRWMDIPAVRNNRVHAIDSDLVNRPSPRCIQGVLEVFRMLHPPIAESVQRCMP